MQIASSHAGNSKKMKEGNYCSHIGIVIMNSLGFKFSRSYFFVKSHFLAKFEFFAQ
jgi:hypothetical protein